LGLGQKTAIGLGHEATGLLPESAGLTIADLANLSLGQGQLLVTPLQVAQLTQAIANDGLLIPAHLIEEVRTSQGMALFRPQRAPSRRVISRQTAARLREAMRAVTESGTGQLARVAEGGAAGKTGSAETGPTGVSHAWFTGFAPTGRPRYVVTVLVEEGGSGGERAAPIFRQIVEGIIASLR
ncbi:MAG: penicillin-binding transpeptidase domain-containing protein, partial [Firmicutes bacterium]|nr:penicillin-binding transpeptidase domain-containing protein [Bacillota bacterium]